MGEKFRLQKRVGIVVAGAAAFFALANGLTLFAALHLRPIAVAENPFVYLLLLMGLCSIPTIIFDLELLRALQTVLFIMMGIVIIFTNEPVNFGGIAFFVYGLLLALRYGYLKRHPYAKFAVAGLLLFVASATALRHHAAFETTAVETTAAAGCFLYLLWITFADEIERYRRESDRLRHDAARNRAFVRFGRHITGVVHDVKSRLMSIEGFNRLITESTCSGLPEQQEYMALQRLGIDELQSMVDGLLLAVRSYQCPSPELFSLGRIVRSAVEAARANRRVRSSLRFVLDLCPDDEIVATPLSVIQILDALLQNAWEATLETARGEIHIRTRNEGLWLVCEIEDRGRGMPFCATCRQTSCLRCENFRIGRTTKPGGSGIGVVHVQALIRDIGGRLRYDTDAGRGTTARVSFPRAGRRRTAEIDTAR